ncbi:MAG TPA: CtsR family transcriptional regulator [Bacillota bacterium]|nr:CtsR family transcriptional regulator [Bacillota bacterium]HPZ91356.1 CtsR family transcriptional regulator [Bacillota bacterium]HQE01981.1 CtsR family transcriptional regulator [Bacillota bacterium]
MNLVDLIELHIKSMLQKSKDNQILLRRNELAQHFGCAPSQINYVIQTRFNVERGYVIESQRGGGGFIRIIRVDVDEFGRALAALSRLGGRISQRQALDFICWLREQELIDSREAALMAAAMDPAVLDIPLPLRDHVRFRMLEAMLEAIIKESG